MVLVDFFKIMTTKAEQLVGLAEDAGFKLSEPELKLLRQVAIGESADFSDKDEDKNNPKRSTEWDDSRCLSAELIIWLCADQEASQALNHQGLKVIGARLEGSLDLSFLRMDFPLILQHCAFMEAIWLERAALRLLDLSGSYITSSQTPNASGKIVATALNARGLSVESDVILREKFCSTGEVCLQRVKIGGNVLCDNSQFSNEMGYSIIAQSAEINGFVYLSDGFKSIGLVSFSNAVISGNLICKSGKFKHEKMALFAPNLEIKGSVFLNGDFEADGEVNFRGSYIGGDFQCSDGKFRNIQGNRYDVSLNLSGSEIKGDVFFNYYFESNGIVKLSNSFIGGNLNCCMGKFYNESYGHLSPPSLVADNTEIKGSVLLNYGFHSIGKIQLNNTLIGGDLHCQNAYFETNKNSNSNEDNLTGPLKNILGDVSSLDANGIDIKGYVQLSEKFIAEGWIRYVGAKIGETFVLVVDNPNLMSIDLRSARISTIEDSKESWPKHGYLALDGLIYEKIAQGSPVDGAERLDWIRRQNLKDNFSPQPYEQAARVLQASGHQEAAIRVLIGKQDDLRKYGGLSKVKQFWNWFLSRTIAHGYKPHRALLFSLAIVFIGLIIFDLGYTHGLIEPSELEAYLIAKTRDSSTPAPIYPGSKSSPKMIKMPPSYPEFYSLMYSVDVFLPIIDFHQESFWIPRASRGKEISPFKLRWGGVLLAYFWVHILLGWVFTSLWVAGFTGLIRRLE